MIKYISYSYLLSFLRCLILKARYGRRLEINPFRVYIGSAVRIRLKKDSRLILDSSFSRIYFDNGVDIHLTENAILNISGGVFFNVGASIAVRDRVSIGKNSMFGPRICLVDHDHGVRLGGVDFRYQSMINSPVFIGNNVWVGSGVVVTKGSYIEDNVVVGANSVVKGKLRQNSLYAGAPARFVRDL